MSYTSLSIASEKGERLRSLAKIQHKTVSSLLAELIDQAAAAAGMDTTSNAVRDQAYQNHFVVDLFGAAYRAELSRAGVESLAANLKTIADKGGTAMDLDHDFSVARHGTGVILSIEAIEKKPGQIGGSKIRLKKSMSPDVAREIAKGLLAGLSAEDAA